MKQRFQFKINRKHLILGFLPMLLTGFILQGSLQVLEADGEKNYILSDPSSGELNVTYIGEERPKDTDSIGALTLYRDATHSQAFGGISYEVVKSLVTIYIPFEMKDSELTKVWPEFAGDGLTFSDWKGLADDGSMNLQKPSVVTVTDADGVTKEYTIIGKRITYNLPVLYLTTEDGTGIDSREEYEAAHLGIDNTCKRVVANGTCSERDLSNNLIATSKPWSEYDLKVRGRGNASWLHAAQKSYLLSFEEEVSLFGMNRAKKYCLLSSSEDPSLIRNCVAMEMAGVLESFEFVAGQLPVDVFLNGSYVGIYTLSEKIDVDSEKVNLFSKLSYEEQQEKGETKTPFLLENGPFSQGKMRFDQMTYEDGKDFVFVWYNERLMLRYPTWEGYFAPEYYEIQEQMNTMGIHINEYTDYENYLDLNNWIDWFIMIELTNNTDSGFHRSTYLYRRAGDTVKLGPIWDYDVAFGIGPMDNKNHDIWTSCETPLLYWKNNYIVRLYKDDRFMLAVRDRWDEVKDSLMDSAKIAVERYESQVEDSRAHHDGVYHKNSSASDTEKILSFLQKRYEWIDESIHKDDFNRIVPDISKYEEMDKKDTEEDASEEASDQENQKDDKKNDE